jgi:antirestriction protein ArdC
LHELTHWTAHPSRLARDLSGRFGEESYAMEELVAELGAAFLCAELGIVNTPRQDHAAYIANWLKVLRDDTKAVFTAASRASEAAEFLGKLQPQHSEAAE